MGSRRRLALHAFVPLALAPAIASFAGVLALGFMASGCDSSTSERTTGNTTLVPNPPNGTILTATAGVPYSQAISFSGWGVSPFTLTTPNGTPAGLALSTTGDGSNATLAGTPSTAGTGAFEIQIQDAQGHTVLLDYGLDIVVNNTPLSLAPATLPAGINGVVYNQTLTVSSGTQPFTWSISSGALPTGLTLSSSTSASNAIAGTPKASGTFTFTVTITDSSSPSKTGNFPYSLVIN